MQFFCVNTFANFFSSAGPRRRRRIALSTQSTQASNDEALAWSAKDSIKQRLSEQIAKFENKIRCVYRRWRRPLALQERTNRLLQENDAKQRLVRRTIQKCANFFLFQRGARVEISIGASPETTKAAHFGAAFVVLSALGKTAERSRDQSSMVAA